MKKGNKISILGAGNVGATIAYTLTMDGMASEIVLVDINANKAKGEAMDIVQGTALCQPVNIHYGEYADVADSDIVIVTIGSARKPGQTRIDLAQGNVNIIKSVMPQVAKYAPDAIYIVVSNPVDIITYTILKTTNLSESQVFGSGTLLDSSRLREMLASKVGISTKNVHAYVFGEHGDTAMVPWSLTSIAGMPLDNYLTSIHNKKPDSEDFDFAGIEHDVHTSGAEVIKLKGATYYAIALSARRICECILRDTNTVVTVSGMLHGEYGIEDVCLSIPFILNANGLERMEVPELPPQELEKLLISADTLKTTIASLDI
jgi:L-lactate dehydrogenase